MRSFPGAHFAVNVVLPVMWPTLVFYLLPRKKHAEPTSLGHIIRVSLRRTVPILDPFPNPLHELRETASVCRTEAHWFHLHMWDGQSAVTATWIETKERVLSSAPFLANHPSKSGKEKISLKCQSGFVSI